MLVVGGAVRGQLPLEARQRLQAGQRAGECRSSGSPLPHSVAPCIRCLCCMRLDGLAAEGLHAGRARALPLLLVQRSPSATAPSQWAPEARAGPGAPEARS